MVAALPRHIPAEQTKAGTVDSGVAVVRHTGRVAKAALVEAAVEAVSRRMVSAEPAAFSSSGEVSKT